MGTSNTFAEEIYCEIMKVSEGKKFKKIEKFKKKKSCGIRRILLSIANFQCIQSDHSACIFLRLLELPVFLWTQTTVFLMYCVNNPEGPVLFMDFWNEREINYYFEIDYNGPKKALYWNGNQNPDIMKPELIAKTWKISNRVYYHIFLLIRLTASCFVGFTQYEIRTTDFNRVLHHVVTKQLTKYIFVVLPIYLLELWLKISIEPICSVFCVVYLTVTSSSRFYFILRNDYGLSDTYLLTMLVRHILGLTLIILNLTLIWTLLPYVECRESFPAKKLNFLDCYDYECTFVNFNLDKCLYRTWLSLVKNEFAQFPFVNTNNSTKKLVDITKYTMGFPSIIYHSALFTVWCMIHRVGMNKVYSMNFLENIYFLFLAAFGYAVYTLYMAGLICSYFYNKNQENMSYGDRLSILDSYFDINNFEEIQKKYFRKYFLLKHLHNDIVFKNELLARLPRRHKETIIYFSYVNILKSTRIFHNIDDDLLYSLSYFLKNKYYLEGETIMNPDTVPAGLTIIRKGTAQVIALNEAIMCQLERGECFGELNICKQLATPLLIIAKSDCHVWNLSREHCSNVFNVAPNYLRKKLLLNHYEILKSARYKFQKSLNVISPYGLKKAIDIYGSSQPTRFPFEYCTIPAEIEEKHSWTDESTFFIAWNYFLALFAFCLWVMIFFISYVPVSSYDIFIVSYNHYNQFSIIFPILSFICIVDFIIWMTIKIWSDQLLLSGTKALKIKFTKYILKTIEKIVSTFLFGYKIIIPMEICYKKLPWNCHHWIIIIFMCLLNLTTMYYSLRAYIFIRKSRNYCAYYQKALDSRVCLKLKQAVDAKCLEEQCRLLYNKTNNSIFLSKSCSNISALTYSEVSFEEKLLNLNSAKAYSYMLSTQMLLKFCQEYSTWYSWRNLVHSNFVNILIYFMDFSLFFGNQFCYTFQTDNFSLFPLLVSLLFSFFATAVINAKYSSYSMACFYYYKEYNITVKTVKNLLPNSENLLKKQCLSYLRLNYLVYNRISLLLSDDLIDLPQHLKLSGKIKKKILRKKSIFSYYDYNLKQSVTASGMYVFYPPGFTVWSSDSQFSVLHIIRGVCVSIDKIGVMTKYTAEDVVGMSSYWFKKQPSTLICKTYVFGFFIGKEVYLKSFLESFFSDTIQVYMRIAPVIEFESNTLKSISTEQKYVENKLISEFSQTYTLNIKERKNRFTKHLILQNCIQNLQIQLFIHCFLMGMLYIVSVVLSIIQIQFLDYPRYLWLIHSVLDSLIIMDGYFIFQQNLKYSLSSIKFSFIYYTFLVFPLDIFFVNSSSKFFILLRSYRIIRLLEPFRRISAFKKLCPEYLNLIFGWEVILRTILHILVLSFFIDIYWCRLDNSISCKNNIIASYFLIPNGIKNIKKILENSFKTTDLNEKYFPIFQENDNNYYLLGSLQEYIKLINQSIVSYSLPILYGQAIHTVILSESDLTFYSIGIYEAINIFTFTGLPISPFSKEMFVLPSILMFLVIFFLSYFHSLYILGSIAGVFTSIDHTNLKRQEKVKNLKFFLESKEIENCLIKEAISCLELYFSTKEYLISLLTYEAINPRTWSSINFNSHQIIFKKLGFFNTVPCDQLYYASSTLKKISICSNQVILNEGQIVDFIKILLTGTLIFVPKVPHKSNISTLKDTKNLPSSYCLKPGECLGLRNINPTLFKLEIWPYQIVTAEDCVFLKISYNDLNALEEKAEIFVKKLYEASEKTYSNITNFNQVLLETSGQQENLIQNCNIFKRFITKRKIFHPAKTSLNFFLILITLIQFFSLIWCSLCLGFLMTVEELKNLLGLKDHQNLNGLITYSFIAAAICAVAHFVSQVHCGYYEKKSDSVIMDPELIWKHMKKPKQIFFLLSSIQPIGVVFFLNDITSYNINLILIWCPILFQFYSIMKYYNSSIAPYSIYLAINKLLLKTILIVVISLTIFTIFWMCGTCLVNKCNISWIGLMPDSQKVVTIHDFIIMSFIVVVNLVGNIGIQSVIPQNSLERFLCSLFMLFGYLVGAYFKGFIISKFNQFFFNQNEKTLKIRGFLQILKKNGLDKKDIAQIKNYLQYSYFGLVEFSKFDTLLLNLHSLLFSKITYSITSKFLNRLFLVKGLDSSYLQYISSYVKSEIFFPGDLIIKENDVVFKAYYIFYGSCQLIFNDGFNKILNVGKVFGQQFLFFSKPARFSVKASQLCICYSLHHEIVTQILISLARFHMADLDIETRKNTTEKDYSIKFDNTSIKGSIKETVEVLEKSVEKLETFKKPYRDLKRRFLSVFQQHQDFFDKLAWKFVHYSGDKKKEKNAENEKMREDDYEQSWSS